MKLTPAYKLAKTRGGFSAVHTLAVIVGTAKGDTYLHLASLLAFEEHLAAAMALGMATRDPKAETDLDRCEFMLTDTGRTFVEKHGVMVLEGRANNWSITPEAQSAIAALEALYAERATK